MNSLDNYRKEIDKIDKELVEIFERRMDLANKVAEYKKENNLPIFNGAREEEVIEKNIANLKNKKYDKILRKFFVNLMELSRSLQDTVIGEKK